jgi:hypothetical protein
MSRGKQRSHAPFAFSRWILSTWTTNFLRYTAVTLPSRPLYFPRMTWTSSSLRTGMERTCRVKGVSPLIAEPGPRRGTGRTLYLSRSSLLRWELIIFLRDSLSLEKYALRLFRLELLTDVLYFIFRGCTRQEARK